VSSENSISNVTGTSSSPDESIPFCLDNPYGTQGS
jgi:hypothetical protein